MIGFITRTTLKGLSVVVPIAVAVAVGHWIIKGADSFFHGLLKRFVPEEFLLPGTGVVLLFVCVFLIGLLMYPWITRKIIKAVDGTLRQIPVFSLVYSPVKDLMELFGGGMEDKLGKPVMVKVPNTDMETLGFKMRDDVNDLPDGFASGDNVVVFVQWSMQMGGFCFVVPRDSIREVDMTVEDGMRFALTAGLSAPAADKKKSDPESGSDEQERD